MPYDNELVPRIELTGHEKLAPKGSPCDQCGRRAVPGMRVWKGGYLVTTLCVWCMARPLEEATGWKIGNAWQQWDAIARVGGVIRAAKQRRRRQRK